MNQSGILKIDDDNNSENQRTVGADQPGLNTADLYSSNSNLQEFIDCLKEIAQNPIRKNVIEHCDKLKLKPNFNISAVQINQLVEKRIEKMIKNKRMKKNWSYQDILILVWIVSKYIEYKELNSPINLQLSDWETIANMIPGSKPEGCMFKWLSLKKSNLSINGWSEQESALLSQIVRQFGENDWYKVSQKLFYANKNHQKIYRNSKQCRQHWNCYLNPAIKKGPWSKQEDDRLLNRILSNNGQKKWAEMVKSFSGRTQNALKNRYTLLMEKQIKPSLKQEQKTELQLIQEYLQRAFVDQFVNISIEQNQKRSFSEKRNKSKCNQKIKNVEKIRTSKRQKNRRVCTTFQENVRPKNKGLCKLRSYTTLQSSQPFEENVKFDQNDKDQQMMDQSFEVQTKNLRPQYFKLEKLQDIKILPFDFQNFKNQIDILHQKGSQLIPCILENNTLTKISCYQAL